MAKYGQFPGSPVALDDALESGFLVVERKVDGCSVFERIFDTAEKALGLAPEGQLLLLAGCLCTHCGPDSREFWTRLLVLDASGGLRQIFGKDEPMSCASSSSSSNSAVAAAYTTNSS